MILHEDRVKLFNWFMERLKQVGKETDVLVSLAKDDKLNMAQFAEELKLRGKSVGLLELAHEILEPSWPEKVDQMPPTLEVSEQRSDT